MAWIFLIIALLLFWGIKLNIFSGNTLKIETGDDLPLTKEMVAKAKLREKNRKAIARSKGRGWKVEP